MKMAYEYTMVSSVFSVTSIPQRWVYPVSILIHAYTELKRQNHPDFELVMQPDFPDEETLTLNKEDYFTELV